MPLTILKLINHKAQQKNDLVEDQQHVFLIFHTLSCEGSITCVLDHPQSLIFRISKI